MGTPIILSLYLSPSFISIPTCGWCEEDVGELEDWGVGQTVEDGIQFARGIGFEGFDD